jgi:hypothetical protein
MVKKSKKIVETTTNRKVFNRAYKEYVSGKNGDCPRCRYHKCENYEGKYYGGYSDYNRITYPSWKLVSKNRKQWMKKPMNIEADYNNYRNEKYVRFKFKRGKNF